MARNRNQQLVKMVQLSILTAVVLVLQSAGTFFPIQILGTNLNLTLIPIVLGAIILGPWAGAWLGLVSGVFTYVVGGVMAADYFTNFLFVANPFITACICVIKTTAAGILAGFAYKLLSPKHELVAVFVAAAVTPVVNTGLFFCGCMIILDTISAFADTLPDFAGMDIMKFIFIVLIGKNFIAELALNLILAPALQRIIRIVRKNVVRR